MKNIKVKKMLTSGVLAVGLAVSGGVAQSNAQDLLPNARQIEVIDGVEVNLAGTNLSNYDEVYYEAFYSEVPDGKTIYATVDDDGNLTKVTDLEPRTSKVNVTKGCSKKMSCWEKYTSNFGLDNNDYEFSASGDIYGEWHNRGAFDCRYHLCSVTYQNLGQKPITKSLVENHGVIPPSNVTGTHVFLQSGGGMS